MPLTFLIPVTWFLDAAMGTLVLACIVHRFERCQNGRFWIECGAFVALFLLFFFCDAYLEYPSDPWEHVKRMAAYRDVNDLSASYIRFKFAYFWGSHLAPWNHPHELRHFLDGYGAFWQLMVTYQVYRLARALGFSPVQSIVQVLGWIAFFGTNLFGFRYYALSSTPLALAAYYGLLGHFVATVPVRKKANGFLVIAALVAMSLNHLQTLLFLAVIAPAFLIDLKWERLTERTKKLIPIITALAAGVGMLIFAFLPRGRPPRMFLTDMATLPVLNPHNQYSETIAITGLIAILFALFRVRRREYRLFCLLTLAPISFLVFPPSALTLATLLDSGNIYRTLYAFPLSFGFVAFGFAVLNGVHARGARTWAGFALVAAFVSMALVYRFPFRGRLAFQFYRPEKSLTLPNSEFLADHLHQKLRWRPSCNLLADEVTSFGVSAWTGWSILNERRDGSPLGEVFNASDFDALIKNRNICAIIVPQRETNFPFSIIGASSGHWPANAVQRAYLTARPVIKYAKKIASQLNWSHFESNGYVIWYRPDVQLTEGKADGTR